MMSEIDVDEPERKQRVINYAVKRAHGFRCAVCGGDVGIVVVKDDDLGFTTRCRTHLGRKKPCRGQWPDRPPFVPGEEA